MGNDNWCRNDALNLRTSTVITEQSQIPVVRGSFDFTCQQTFKKIQSAASSFCQKRNLDNHYIPTVARIIAYRHDNLFGAYQKLQQQNSQQFMDDLTDLDIEFMDSLYFNLVQSKTGITNIKDIPNIVPFINLQNLDANKIEKYKKIGINLTQQYRIAVVFMCAGSSSRFMGYDKFLQPLQIEQKKCILELMFERLKNNLSVKCQTTIPIIIVCNDSNRNKIQKFLNRHQYFGFDTSRFRFLQTKNLPILSQKGKFCLSFQYKILTKPSGTAQCVQAVLTQNTYNFLVSQKIKYIHFCGMENLAENPADPLLIGLIHSEKKLVCGKCVDPHFETQLFHRYVEIDKKISLLDVQTLSSLSKTSLLEQSPIAMNSIIFEFEHLKSMTEDYANSMYLSKKYHIQQTEVNHFDFIQDKPALKQKCYSFQKNISDLLACFPSPLILKCPRNQFIPLISREEEYSIKSASFKYKEFYENNKQRIQKKIDRAN